MHSQRALTDSRAFGPLAADVPPPRSVIGLIPPIIPVRRNTAFGVATQFCR